MLAAMIQAAKSDGTFEDAEKEKLLGQLGDVDAEEAAFVQAQMQAPVDVDNLVANTPEGLGQQVYAMSVSGNRPRHRRRGAIPAQTRHRLRHAGR